MVSTILTIGLSDSCAGTGIQADIKTAQSYGGYAVSVVSAVSAQNTKSVSDIHVIPANIVRQQIETVLSDINVNVIKAGMLATAEIINVVGDFLDDMQGTPVKFVLDPVMTGRTSHDILDKEAKDALKRRLMLRADIITPNIFEATELSGLDIHDLDGMCHAAETLRTLGAKTVILKGGAIAHEKVYDVLADDHGSEVYKYEKKESTSTHGAGSTLSAGIAMGLAQGLDERDSFVKARAYVEKAMESPPEIGSGYGPLNHTVRP